MDLIHDRLLNNQFAPGIATYGIDGKDGAEGPAGTSIYFTSYSLEDTEQRDKAIVKINRNLVLSEFVDLSLERKYAVGDLILDAVGRIFKIVMRNGQFALDFVTSVIGVEDNTYFRTSGNNRLYLASSYNTLNSIGNTITNNINGLDIIQGAEDNSLTLGTSPYMLRVVNTKEDSKTGKYNILQLMTKPVLGEEKVLNISYDRTNNAFVLESGSNIVIDSDNVMVKQTSPEDSLGDYYKITPYSDPIGLVHKMLSGASWNVSGSKLTISGIDLTPIHSLGLQDKFTVKYFNGTTYVFEQNAAVNSDGKIIVNSVSGTVSQVSVIRGIEVFIKNQ